MVADAGVASVDGSVVDDSDAAPPPCPNGLQFVDEDTEVNTPDDLDALTCVVRIAGDLTITCPACTNLQPLEYLAEISGDLRIADSHALVDATGLGRLATVNDVEIQNNDSLESLVGFGPVTNVSWLLITGNAKLESLEGLGHLRSGYWMIIRHNPVLAELRGLHNLVNVSRELAITYNDALASVEGLNSLATVHTLNISQTPLLSDLRGLESLTRVTRELILSFNVALASLAGLENLTEVASYWFEDNDVLPVCAEIAWRDLIGIDAFSFKPPMNCDCDGLWEANNCP